MIKLSDTWKAAYPSAVMGFLAMRNAENPSTDTALEQRKRETEERLRARFLAGNVDDLKILDTIQPYIAYYRRFGKSYHVLAQLESVALRGKPIPSVAALVEAMFLAELETQLLTAGHDLESVRTPVTVDVAAGTERFVRINGQEQQLKAGDMITVDGEGVISSVIYGPDFRTRITPDTRGVLFVTYAPPGISEDAVLQHLEAIRSNVLLFAPEAETVLLRTCTTT